MPQVCPCVSLRVNLVLPRPACWSGFELLPKKLMQRQNWLQKISLKSMTCGISLIQKITFEIIRHIVCTRENQWLRNIGKWINAVFPGLYRVLRNWRWNIFTDHWSLYKKEIDEHRLSQSENQIIYTKKIMGANAICSQDFSGIYCVSKSIYTANLTMVPFANSHVKI